MLASILGGLPVTATNVQAQRWNISVADTGPSGSFCTPQFTIQKSRPATVILISTLSGGR